MSVADGWLLSCLRKRFYRTIEIEVSPKEFTYRYKDREHRVPTRGYLRKSGGDDWGYQFEEKCETTEHVPIDLSCVVPLEFRPDIGKVLAAFLWYGMRPLCNRLVRPALGFKGIERFDTGLGFEYAAFREAGAQIAADGEVHFQVQATPATKQ